jgi:uridine phosphorylase
VKRLYSLSETDGRIGALGGFGIGGPATAACMEELIAHATEAFCIVGGCGGLGGNVVPHEPVICDRAIRDEGVSHHYLPTETYVSADNTLVTHVEDTLSTTGLNYQTGASWTTDAIYRETIPEIEHYRDEGILTVEMEAATAFAVAEYREIAAVALLCPFDLVMADEWQPAHGTTIDGLRDLLGPARDALAAYLSR